MLKLPVGNFHSIECATQYAREKQLKARRATDNKKKREEVKRRTEKKEKIRKRTGKGGYYESLKTALHYYVKHVLRKGEPCYTCGKEQRPSDSGGAFHVGHFIAAKQTDPRRFMLENLRIQCYSCNAIHSGRRAEYRQQLIAEKGLDHVEWLECEANHESLLIQYKSVEDIKQETARYRALARSALSKKKVVEQK